MVERLIIKHKETTIKKVVNLPSKILITLNGILSNKQFYKLDSYNFDLLKEHNFFGIELNYIENHIKMNLQVVLNYKENKETIDKLINIL